MLHVLSVLDLEVLWDAAGSHLLTHIVLFDASMVETSALVLRDCSPLVYSREAGLIL